MKEWSVVLRPVAAEVKLKGSRNKSKVKGLALMLTDGYQESEISRVAFQRPASNNPDEDFIAVLDIKLDQAQDVVELMNEFEQERERMEKDRDWEAGEKIREILGANKLPNEMQ